MTDRQSDPVCGMQVDPSSAAGQSEYQGKPYYFCALGCKQEFDSNPARYARPAAPAVAGSGLVQLMSGRDSEPSTARVELPVSGMTCAACAHHIEQALSQTPGVRSAHVNFATSRATVEYAPASASLASLVSAVRRAGYDAPATGRIDFVVETTALPSAPVRLQEKQLLAVSGVTGASLNPATMELTIDYLRGITDAQSVKREIEGLGYRLRPAASTESVHDNSDDNESEYRDLRRRFWVAAILSIPVVAIAMTHVAFAGATWIELILTTPIVFYSGWQFYKRAWSAFRHRNADM